MLAGQPLIYYWRKPEYQLYYPVYLIEITRKHMKQAAMTDSTSATRFKAAYKGAFTSLLGWEQLASFWDVLRSQADAGWYIYDLSSNPPDTPQSADEVLRFIDEIDALLHREHKEDYCGIVYADNRTEPEIIKIYDPNNLGVVCGFSNNPPPPGWLLSRIPPETVDHNEVIPENRRRWWQRLWA